MHISTKDFKNAKPVYDRSAIMKRAWEIVRKTRYNLINMRYAMYQAWSEAKRAAMTASQQFHARISESIAVIENKSRLTDTDYTRIAELKHQLKAIA